MAAAGATAAQRRLKGAANPRTTSTGLWRFGKEYLTAATLVQAGSKNKFSSPAYYLVGHAIELTLKAFLVARGVPVAELRSKRFGHNLVALVTRARKHRLGEFVKLGKSEIQAISLLNEQYASKKFEYIETGPFTLPPLSGFVLLATAMVTSLEKFCFEAAYGKSDRPAQALDLQHADSRCEPGGSGDIPRPDSKRRR